MGGGPRRFARPFSCEAMTEETLGTSPQNSTKIHKKRRLSGVEWAAIRNAFEVEGEPLSVLARLFGLTVKALSMRKAREGWGDGPSSAAGTTMEEILTVRNMNMIKRMLRTMDRKLQDLEADPAQTKAADIGKDARAIQALTRATETAAATRRKVRAHDAGKRTDPVDRGALERKLLMLEEKLRQAEIPTDAER